MKTPAVAHLSPAHWLASFFLFLLLASTSALPAHAQNLTLQTASGGIAISGSKPAFSSGFGNVNGLGAGTPPAATTLITSGVSGGVLYATNIDLRFTGAGGSNSATSPQMGRHGQVRVTQMRSARVVSGIPYGEPLDNADLSIRAPRHR